MLKIQTEILSLKNNNVLINIIIINLNFILFLSDVIYKKYNNNYDIILTNKSFGVEFNDSIPKALI